KTPALRKDIPASLLKGIEAHRKTLQNASLTTEQEWTSLCEKIQSYENLNVNRIKKPDAISYFDEIASLLQALQNPKLETLREKGGINADGESPQEELLLKRKGELMIRFPTSLRHR